MGKPMQYYERSHGPYHLEDEFRNREYAIKAAKDKRKAGHRAKIVKSRGVYRLYTDE